MQWIKCSEQFPDREGIYLTFNGNPGTHREYRILTLKFVKCHSMTRKPAFIKSKGIARDVTHWMELPERPEE